MDINEQMNAVVSRAELIREIQEAPEDTKIMCFWWREEGARKTMDVYMKTVGSPYLTNMIKICHHYADRLLDDLLESSNEQEAE